MAHVRHTAFQNVFLFAESHLQGEQLLTPCCKRVPKMSHPQASGLQTSWRVLPAWGPRMKILTGSSQQQIREESCVCVCVHACMHTFNPAFPTFPGCGISFWWNIPG